MFRSEIRDYLQLTEVIREINPRDLVEELYNQYNQLEEKYITLQKQHRELEILYRRQGETLFEQHKIIKKYREGK